MCLPDCLLVCLFVCFNSVLNGVVSHKTKFAQHNVLVCLVPDSLQTQNKCRDKTTQFFFFRCQSVLCVDLCRPNEACPVQVKFFGGELCGISTAVAIAVMAVSIAECLNIGMFCPGAAAAVDLWRRSRGVITHTHPSKWVHRRSGRKEFSVYFRWPGRAWSGRTPPSSPLRLHHGPVLQLVGRGPAAECPTPMVSPWTSRLPLFRHHLPYVLLCYGISQGTHRITLLLCPTGDTESK